MTFHKWTCFFFILASMTIACKKDSDSKVTGALITDVCPSFSGYTGTDASGNIIGPIDISDWGLYDTWNQCEKGLFSGTNYNSNCTFYSDTTFHDTIIYISCGPNPTSNIFYFHVGAPAYADTSANPVIMDSTMTFEMILMNQRREILVDTVIPQMNHFHLYYSLNSTPPTDTIFRIYYRFTDINNCVRIGHGDIMRY